MVGNKYVVFKYRIKIKPYHCYPDMNKTKWCNGFYMEFRQSFTKETFSYDERLKS